MFFYNNSSVVVFTIGQFRFGAFLPRSEGGGSNRLPVLVGIGQLIEKQKFENKPSNHGGKVRLSIPSH
jgi:hypothetical protein